MAKKPNMARTFEKRSINVACLLGNPDQIPPQIENPSRYSRYAVSRCLAYAHCSFDVAGEMYPAFGSEDWDFKKAAPLPIATESCRDARLFK